MLAANVTFNITCRAHDLMEIVVTTAIARSAAAERMRHHRERRRQGVRCLMIELSEAEIDGIIREGLLPAELRNEPFALIWALYDHLDRTLVHVRDVKRANADHYQVER